MGSPPGRPPPRSASGGRGSPAALVGAAVLAAIGLRAYNLVGFPAFGPAEGAALRAALGPLRPGPPGEGAGPAAPGALLLGLLLWLLGFPDRTIAPSLTLGGAPPLTPFTVWTFLFIPRMAMVALAAGDTFLVYLLGRRLLRPGPGALAAALAFAAAPLGLYTRLVLPDNVALPLFLGGLVLLLPPGRAGPSRPASWLAAGLLLALALLASVAVLLLLPTVLIATVGALRRLRGPRRRALRALVLWGPVAAVALALGPGALAAFAAAPAGPAIVGARDAPGLARGLLALDPLLLVLGGAGLVAALLADRPLLVAWALGGVAYLLLGPLPADALVIPSLPLLALAAGGLVGGGLGASPPGRGRWLAAAALAVALGVQMVGTAGADLSSPTVEALRYTLAVANPGSLVIAGPTYLWALEAFANRFTAASWADPDLPRLVASHEQVYLVVDPAFRAAMEGDPLLARLHALARPLAAFAPGGGVEVRGRIAYTITARVLHPDGNPQVGGGLRIADAGGALVYEGVNLTHRVLLERGNYTVEARGAGGRPVAALALHLTADVNLAFVDLPGSPLGTLTTGVAFEDGNPVPWAAVNLSGPAFAFLDRGRESRYIALLPPGDYRVAVAGSRGQPLETRQVTLAPGGTVALEVVEGGLPGTTRAQHDLYVTLQTPEGLGVRGALVTLLDEGGRAVARGPTAFDGTYTVRLPAGAYGLRVEAPGLALGAAVPLDRDRYVDCVGPACSVA